MDNIKTKGIEGELAFKEWLDKNGLSYIYIDQSSETFATLFKQSVKRPDFLMLLESIGMLAIDVKNYSLSRGVFTLGMTDEFIKALTFERLFRLPLWYVYKSEDCWYWISALKAIEVGTIRKNTQTNKDFLAIPVSQFEKIKDGSDLGLLYTHRLPKVENISHIPAELAIEPEVNQLGDWETYYDFNSNYTPNRVTKIIQRWSRDVRFNIDYRRGEHRYLCTKELKLDLDLIALIDSLNVQLMYEVDTFLSPITVYGTRATVHQYFAMDHLIYAVSSVFYDDKNGSYYTIFIDEAKLTAKGKEAISRNRNKPFLAQIGMSFGSEGEFTEEESDHGGYALFAHIE